MDFNTVSRLRETLNQYIDIVKNLTGQNTNNDYIMEISEILIKNENNLRSARDIEEAFTEAKIEIQFKFWESLSNSLMEKLLENKIEIDYTNEAIAKFYNQSKNNIYFGIGIKLIDLEENLKLSFRIEVEHEIIFGFKLISNGDKKESCRNEKYKFIDKAINANNDFKFSRGMKWPGWWTNTNFNLNFRDFNSQDIFELTDTYKRKILTDKLAEKAKSLIKKFNDEYSEIKNNKE